MEFLNEYDAVSSLHSNYNQAQAKVNQGIGRNVQKHLDAVLTLEDKAKLAQRTQKEKYQSLDGYEQGYITGAADGDTFILTLPDGSTIKTRLASNRGLYVDAIETSHPNFTRPDYGLREDGTPKGQGWLGELTNPTTGDVITELSTSFNFDGQDVLAPLITPNLSKEEIQHLVMGGEPTDEIVDKAANHAMSRLQKGLSPFRDDASVSDDIYANANKRVIQPRLVSQLLGKSRDQLTDEDYDLVGREQLNTILNQLRATDEGIPGVDGFQEGERIPVAFKIVGEDKYGRALVEYVNANTREAVTNNLANDPRFNAAFTSAQVFGSSVPKTRRTEQNKQLIDTLDKAVKDSDLDRIYGNSTIGEWVDVAEASWYRMAASLLNIGDEGDPDSWRSRWNDSRRKQGKPGWDELANTDINYALSQSYAGVNPKTREVHEQKMREYEGAIDRGDYLDAIVAGASDLGYILAESAPSMAAVSGGTIIPATIGVIGSILGGIAYVAQRTYDQMDAYTRANGHAPSKEHLAKALGWNILTTFGEQLIIKTGASSLFSKPVQNAIHTMPKKILPNAGKGIVFGAGTEFFQEGGEQLGDIYFAQNDASAEDFTKLMFSKDVFKGALLGAIAGGALGGGASLLSAPVSAVKNRNLNKEVEARQEAHKEKESKTYFEGSSVDQNVTKRVSDFVDRLGNTQQDLTRINAILSNSKGIAKVNQLTVDKALAKKQEILEHLAKENKLPAEISKEQLLKDTVFHSDPFGMNDTKGRITQEESQRRKEHIKEVGKDLGFTEEQVTKSMTDVANEVRTGVRNFIGVDTYQQNIGSLTSRIDRLAPDSKERTKLETQRDNLVNNLANFRESQSRKLEAIIAAAVTIADGRATDVQLPNSTFKVRGKNLLHDSYGSRIGTHHLVASLVDVVTKADETLQSYNDNNNRRLSNFGQVSERLETYKKALAKISTKTEQELANPKSVVTKVKDKLLGTTTESKAKIEPMDVISPEMTPQVTKALKYVLDKGVESVAGSKQLTRLKTAFPKSEAWTDFKARYEGLANPNTKVLDLVDSIIGQKIENQEAINNDKIVVARIKKTAEQFKPYFTKEKIQGLTSLNRLVKVSEKVQKITRNVIQAAALDLNNDAELLALRDFFDNVNKELQVKQRELAQLEAKKIIEAAKKKQSSEESKVDDQTPTEEAPDSSIDESEDATDIQIREEQKAAVKILLDSNLEAFKKIEDKINSKLAEGKKKVVSLARELVPSSRPQARFLMGGVTLVDYVKGFPDVVGNSIMEDVDTLMDLTPIMDLAKDARGNPINDELAYLLTEIDGSSRWSSDPALGLIYNLIISDKTITNDKGQTRVIKNGKVDFEMKPEMAAAIDFSLREYFSTMSLSETLRPVNNDDLQRVFDITLSNKALGLSDLSPEARAEAIRKYTKEARELVNTYGIPRTFITNKIGEAILDNIGLSRNRATGTINFYDRLAESLGTLALRYATNNKLITQIPVEPSEVKASFIKAQKTIPFIKMTEENEADIKDYRSLYKDLSEKFKIEKNKPTGPKTEPGKVSNKMLVQGTKGLSNVPHFVRGVMKKIFNTPYNINSKLVDKLFIAKNEDEAKILREQVLKQLGWMSNDEMKKLHYEARESQKGKNLQAEHDYDAMAELIQKQRETGKEYTDYFFDYSMTRGGRYNMISNTVNPQSSKFHRFLMLPANLEKTYTIGNPKQLEFTYFAIAQAFDALTNVAKGVSSQEHIATVGKAVMAENIDQMMDDLIALPSKQFVKKYEHTGIDGIENFSQALLVLQHLKDYKTTEASGKKNFESFLAIENDSTTSGYAIRMLQMPDEGLLKNFASKVGILRAQDGYNVNNDLLTIHELKGDKTFLDIYKTMASAAGKKLSEIEKIDGMRYFQQYKDSKTNKEILSTIFEKMLNNLPMPDKDGVVPSSLRKLIKVAAIPFGYTSGEHSITSSLSESIMSEFIANYTDAVQNTGKLSTEQTVAKDVFAYLEQFYDGEATYIEAQEGKSGVVKHAKDLYTALMNVPISDIQMIVDGQSMSLDGLFDRVLNPTYGKAVWNSLSESFESTITYNNALNDMVKTMFNLFNNVLEKEMKILRKEYGNDIPITKEEQAILKVFDLFPAMKLPYNTTRDGIFESALLFDTTKVTSPESRIQTMYGNKQGITSDTSYADVRKFIDAGQAGAVLPIHFMDGMIMSFILDKYGENILGVHDAFIMSALDNLEVTKAANEIMYLLSEQFDLFDSVVGQFNDNLAVYEKMTKTNLDGLAVNLKTGDIFVSPGAKADRNIIDFTELKDRTFFLNSANQDARDTFYRGSESQNILLSNIDGIAGSGYKVDGSTLAEHQLYTVLLDVIGEGTRIARRDSEDIKLIRDRLKGLGSDPNNWIPNSKLRFYEQTGIDSVQTRVQIAEDLRKLDTKGLTDSEFNHLVDVIINRVNPKNLENLVVAFEDNLYTTGNLNEDLLAIGIDDNTDLVDPITRQSINSLMSAVEVYAHELVHAGVRMPIIMHKELGYTSVVHQLLDLQRRASKIVSWEDFMPDTYSPSLKQYYEANAKKVWDYIFNNDSIADLRGLNEFVAYGLTHKKMMQKLNSVFIDTSNIADKAKFLDRLVSLGIALLDVFRGEGKIKDIFKTGAKVLKGDLNLRNREAIYTELVRLNDKMNKINQKTVSGLYSQISSKIQDIFEFITELKQKADKYFSTHFTSKLFNFVDEFGLSYNQTMNGIHGSLFEPIKILAWIMALPFSKTRRNALPTVLRRTLNLSQQSVLSSVLRDIQTPDRQTAALERMSALTRMVDGASKSLESNYYINLDENFDMRDSKGRKRQLTDEEQKSLTRTVLYTDLSSLATIQDGNVTNMSDIMDLLKDTTLLNKAIDDAVNSLGKSVKDRKQLTWYLNSAKGLAEFMVSGKGVIGQNLNARNIAQGRMTGHTRWASVSEDIITKIDQLTSLYALSFTDINDRFMTATLTEKGLANMLNVHRNFVNESRAEKVVEPMHEIKGYTKSLLDSTIDMKVAPINKQIEMKKAGYKQVKVLGSNKFTGQGGLAIYLRTWNTPQRRDGAAFGITSVHSIGTSLKESAYNIASDFEKTTGNSMAIKDIRDMHDVFKQEADIEANRIIDLMQSRELSRGTLIKLSEANGGYMPIASPNGGIYDYRITMSVEDKIKYLDMKENSFNILSKMYATKNSKLEFKVRNDILAQFLEKDMNENLTGLNYSDNKGREFRLNKEGKEYIRVTPDTHNTFLKEAYQAIPKELKDLIKKYDKEGTGFWVRDEWLQQLFGSPNISVVDHKFIAKWTNAHMKKWLLIAEHILKNVAYIAKQNTVIRYPAVLVGNVISNFNLSVSFGSNPTKVFQKTIENAKYIRDYVDNKKTLDRITIKKNLGTASKEELSSMNWYQSKLDNNPLDILMKKGMYQSIVEDIAPNEMESVGKVSKLLQTKLKNVPKPVKTFGRHLFMTEGTPVFDLLFQATQYSDFVARATEYQLQMEKIENKKLRNGKPNPNYIEKYEKGKNGKVLKDSLGRSVISEAYFEYEQKITDHVWSAFINYDRPQSSKEQYLNDLGLMMFTKFLKRIQPVIFRGMSEAPVSTALFLLLQATIMDTSDIYEYIPLNRDLTWNFFNPITDNLINATSPVAVQVLLGYGLF